MKVGKIDNTGEELSINLEKLVATRMLIQANSGGGKSWLGRKILEGFSGKIQQIVIDLEGEFSTLREEYDFLLIGKEGEVPANIQTAELLAKRLLEINVSAIIDLSELKHHERITFVKRFLDSLIDSPRELWHPLLLYIDEAHIFCPEGKSGKAESKSSVIDLATRGRKRGFGSVLMTQRISKLDKDACAELNNKFIGRATLDIDRKRASEELGFTSKEDERSLRDMDAGEFYAFGPAMSKLGINKVKIGNVKTTHPDRTKGIGIKASSTPENIKKILKDVIDLSKEAKEEIKTKEDMQKKIQELNHKLGIAERSVQEKIQEKIINVTDEKALQKAKDEGFKEAERFYKSYISPIEQNTKVLRSSILKLVKDSEKLLESKAFSMVSDIPTPTSKPVNIKSNLKTQIKNIPIRHDDTKPRETITPERYAEDYGKLKAGAVRMLKAVAMFNSLSREKAKTLAGISNPTTFSTYIQDLKRAGCITEENRILNITDEGIGSVGDIPELPTDTQSLINMWAKFIKAGAIRMLNICVERYPNSITREELRIESEIENPTTFSTYVQDLKRNGLIKIEGGEITAAQELFE